MHTRRRSFLAAMTCTAALVLAACGGDADDAASSDVPATATDGAGTDGDVSQGTTGGSVGEVAIGGGTDPAADAGDGVLAAVGQSGDALSGRSIVRDVTVSLEVDDPAAAVDRITLAARRAGGFVAQAELHRVQAGERRDLLQGTLTLRVPADRLEETVTAIGELATVPPETSLSTRDVTSQLVDVEARLTNLRALEEELRSFLTEARRATGATPDSVLTVFDRVSQVRGEIERLVAQQASLQDLVTLATIRVDLRPAVGAAAVVPDGWSPQGVLRSAARATVATAQVVANALIWLAVFVVPVGLVLGAPVVAAAWWRRRNTAPAA